MKKIKIIQELGIVLSLGYGGNYVSKNVISPSLDVVKKTMTSNKYSYSKPSTPKIIIPNQNPRSYTFPYNFEDKKPKEIIGECKEKPPNTKTYYPTFGCYQYNKNEFYRYYIKKEFHNLFNTKKVNIIKNKNDFIVWINFMEKSSMLKPYYFIAKKLYIKKTLEKVN